MKLQTRICKADFVRVLGILFLSFGAMLGIQSSTNMVFHMACIWTVVLVAALAVDLDVMHPWCWFSALFTLYNTAHSIMLCFDVDSSYGAGYTKENTLYALLALVVVLVVIGPRRIDLSVYPEREVYINPRFTKLLFYIMSVTTIIFAFILKSRGYSGKTEMKAEGDIFYRIGVHLIRWTLIYGSLLLCNLLNRSDKATKLRISYLFKKNQDMENSVEEIKKNKSDRKDFVLIILFSAVASFSLGLLTGERDIIFRYIILIILLFSFFGIITKKHILTLIPILMGVLILSLYFKYYFLGVNLNTRYSADNLIVQFLYADFYAAGGNFQWLLDSPWTKGYFGFSLLFKEILRVVFSFSDPSLSYWFNNVVFPGKYKHRAFTLLGNGYVMGGALGIILLFILVALLVKFFYVRCYKNVYYFVFYVFVAITVMSSFRQSLYGIADSLVKGILMAYIVHKFFIRHIK